MQRYNEEIAMDGYVVRRTTDMAVGICKASEAFSPLTWLPRSACEGGDALDVGDTDIVCREFLAGQTRNDERRGLAGE